MHYDKGNYSTDSKKLKENSAGHNPNDGENQMTFSGSTEGSRDESIYDKAGVEDGLSTMESISVKNAEHVCPNQRPKGMTEKISGDAGSFKLGVS